MENKGKRKGKKENEREPKRKMKGLTLNTQGGPQERVSRQKQKALTSVAVTLEGTANI